MFSLPNERRRIQTVCKVFMIQLECKGFLDNHRHLLNDGKCKDNRGNCKHCLFTNKQNNNTIEHPERNPNI